MARFLFIDESGYDSGESPYAVLGGVAIEDRELQIGDLISYIISWAVRFPAMDLPSRDELAPLADRVLQLRHRSVRDVEENPNFVVWSLAYIRDLRSREERNEGALAGLISRSTEI